MSKIIFIVEDDENIREMLKVALTSFSYEVKAFSNAEDALFEISVTRPDMIIFDVMLPGMNGLEATKLLRGRQDTKNLPIVMLTAKDTELDKVAGLDCGADDYIVKPFGVMELGARVRSLFRRTEKQKSTIEGDIAICDLLIKNSTREVLQNCQPLKLTYKEFELLLLLIKERKRIVPREELIDSIWGLDFVGEPRTLDIHVRTLRQKLGDNAENPKYIKTIRNVGYRFIGEN